MGCKNCSKNNQNNQDKEINLDSFEAIIKIQRLYRKRSLKRNLIRVCTTTVENLLNQNCTFIKTNKINFLSKINLNVLLEISNISFVKNPKNILFKDFYDYVKTSCDHYNHNKSSSKNYYEINSAKILNDQIII